MTKSLLLYMLPLLPGNNLVHLCLWLLSGVFIKLFVIAMIIMSRYQQGSRTLQQLELHEAQGQIQGGGGGGGGTGLFRGSGSPPPPPF